MSSLSSKLDPCVLVLADLQSRLVRIQSEAMDVEFEPDADMSVFVTIPTDDLGLSRS